MANEYQRAEYILWEILRDAPKAPTTTYLLGLSLLMQGRYIEARRLIDRTYQLRPWINDRIMIDCPFKALMDAAANLPDWPWPIYQIQRERWRGVGVSLRAAVSHITETSNSFRTFIQVGANDGKSGDPLHRLIRQGQLRGLLVEPQEAPFAALQDQYRGVAGLRFEQAAIVEQDGPVTMHTTDDRTTLGTLVPDRNIMRLRKAWREVTVPGLTMRTLLDKHELNEIDVLQIDTEGYDYQILRQVDLTGMDVKIVNMEFYCLPIAERVAAMKQLDDTGFAWFFDGMDLLSVRKTVFTDLFCMTDLLASQDLGQIRTWDEVSRQPTSA